MLILVKNIMFYGVIFLSLFLIDYLLGNGFVDIFQQLYCKIICFVKKSWREQAKQASAITENENPISLPILLTEILILSLTVAFLKRYKQMRGKGRIDELLQENKETLRQTNEFLEKWRLRHVPTECSYLDDEPQEIKPLKLEVPILHMAIIDTLGTNRSQPERGDAGDTINFTDSTLLSVTSLVDDEFESLPETNSEEKFANTIEDTKAFEFNNRYLWDVMEEDANFED